MNRRDFFTSVLSGKRRTNAVTTSLERWQPSEQNPWDRDAALHFFHRLGMPPSKEWLEDALEKGPQQCLDEMFDDRLVGERMPEPPGDWELWLHVPPYRGSDHKEYSNEEGVYQVAKVDIRHQWAVLMSKRDLMFREKLMLFWSNHFVIQEQKIYHTQQVYRFLTYLRKNVWGNFKQMVKDISIQPAMLVFLDGIWSEKDKLNENYARELMELFTMGITDRDGKPNYTQQDVRAVALALTGWRFRYESPPPDVMQEYMAWYYFDYETKTSPWGAPPKIYGLLASNDPKIEADVLETMFELRADAIAWHICKKLYNHFVHRDTDAADAQAVIEQLAERFKQDWELKPVLEMLLRSEHFFHPEFRGADIKSPHDMMIGSMVQLGVELTLSAAGTMAWRGIEMNQWLMDPVNVKGWPGHRAWLTSGTLQHRMYFLTRFVSGIGVESHYINPRTGFGYEWIEWKSPQVLAWGSQFESYTKDIAAFMREVSALIFIIQPEDSQLEHIIDKTISFPRYEWPALSDDERVILTRKLVIALLSLPEYQIC